MFHLPGSELLERESGVADRGRIIRRGVQALAIAHTDSDSVAAFFGIGMAARDAVAAILSRCDTDRRAATIAPGDAGRERVGSAVSRAGSNHTVEDATFCGTHTFAAYREYRTHCHRETGANRTGCIVAVGDRTGDGGGADGEGRARGGGAANRGQGAILIHRCRRLVGHNGPVRTSSGGRDIGWHIAEREIRVVDRHGEALADRTIGIVTISDCTGDGGGADGEGRAGGRSATRGRQRVILIHDGWQGIRDDGSLGTGGIGRDVGGHVSEREIVIRWRVVGLVGPHIAHSLRRGVRIRACVAALVSGWANVCIQRNDIDGRATLLQGHGLRRPSIVGQPGELRTGMQAR